MPAQVFDIKSDSSSKVYKVVLNTNGKVFCNCKGFTYYGRCKHVWRAKARPEFVRARALLIEKGVYADVEEFNAMFSAKFGAIKKDGVKLSRAKNKAISEVIKEAFGFSSDFAIYP